MHSMPMFLLSRGSLADLRVTIETREIDIHHLGKSLTQLIKTAQFILIDLI